jgi:hypothetical protein
MSERNVARHLLTPKADNFFVHGYYDFRVSYFDIIQRNNSLQHKRIKRYSSTAAFKEK